MNYLQELCWARKRLATLQALIEDLEEHVCRQYGYVPPPTNPKETNL